MKLPYFKCATQQVTCIWQMYCWFKNLDFPNVWISGRLLDQTQYYHTAHVVKLNVLLHHVEDAYVTHLLNARHSYRLVIITWRLCLCSCRLVAPGHLLLVKLSQLFHNNFTARVLIIILTEAPTETKPRTKLRKRYLLRRSIAY